MLEKEFAKTVLLKNNLKAVLDDSTDYCDFFIFFAIISAMLYSRQANKFHMNKTEKKNL